MPNLKKTNNYNSIGTSQGFSKLSVPSTVHYKRFLQAKKRGGKLETGFDHKPTLPVQVRSI